MRIAILPVLAAIAAAPAFGAEPRPEVSREPAAPQAVGAVHTLRQIPEACARIEGVFTGDDAEPYRFAVVRTDPACQARARFVDFDRAGPSEATGWKFNDLVRVPRADCPSQQAVVRIWRRPVEQAPELDGQGRARIYLEESLQAAAAGRTAPVPMYAARMEVEGAACR